MGALSESEVRHYRQHGYVVPSYRLSPERVLELRSALATVIDANPETRPEQLVSVHTREKGVEGVVGDAIFLELARDRQILDLIEQLIGPDIVMWGCQAFCKPAGDGMEVPWHQDGHYWPINPLATVTAWIAIDDSTVENGCLRVIPDSHLDQYLHGHLVEDRKDVVLNRRVKNRHFDENSAVDIELEAGQLSLHDIYLIHGSNPNRSPHRRAGLAIRYMPATSLFDRESGGADASAGYMVDFSTRPIWIVRGQDRTGRNDFLIGHQGPSMPSQPESR